MAIKNKNIVAPPDTRVDPEEKDILKRILFRAFSGQETEQPMWQKLLSQYGHLPKEMGGIGGITPPYDPRTPPYNPAGGTPPIIPGMPPQTPYPIAYQEGGPVQEGMPPGGMPMPQGGMPTGETANAGIMEGFNNPEDTPEIGEAVAEKISQDFENIRDFADVMNMIRGDEKTIDERKTELADVVGEEDAQATPDSSLTITQFGMKQITEANQQLEQGEEAEGIAGLPEGQEAVDMDQGALMGAQPMPQPQVPQVPETVMPGMAFGGMVQGYAGGGAVYSPFLRKHIPIQKFGVGKEVVKTIGKSVLKKKKIKDITEEADKLKKKETKTKPKRKEQDVWDEIKAEQTKKKKETRAEKSKRLKEESRKQLTIPKDVARKLEPGQGGFFPPAATTISSPRGITGTLKTGVAESPTIKKVHQGRIIQQDPSTGEWRSLDLGESRQFAKQYRLDENVKKKADILVGPDGTAFNMHAKAKKTHQLPAIYKDQASEYAEWFKLDRDTGKVYLLEDQRTLPQKIKTWMKNNKIKTGAGGVLISGATGYAIWGGDDETKTQLQQTQESKHGDTSEYIKTPEQMTPEPPGLNQMTDDDLREATIVRDIKFKKKMFEEHAGPDKKLQQQQKWLLLAQFGLNLAKSRGGISFAQQVAEAGTDPIAGLAELGANELKAKREMDYAAVMSAFTHEEKKELELLDVSDDIKTFTFFRNLNSDEKQNFLRLHNDVNNISDREMDIELMKIVKNSIEATDENYLKKVEELKEYIKKTDASTTEKAFSGGVSKREPNMPSDASWDKVSQNRDNPKAIASFKKHFQDYDVDRWLADNPVE